MQKIIAKGILYNGITTEFSGCFQLGWHLVSDIFVSSISLKGFVKVNP